jgi:hypothetical protein
MQRMLELIALKEDMHKWKSNLRYKYISEDSEFEAILLSVAKHMPFSLAGDATDPTTVSILGKMRVHDLVLGYTEGVDTDHPEEMIDGCPYPLQLLGLMKVFALSMVTEQEDVVKFINTDDVDACFHIGQRVQRVIKNFSYEKDLVLNIFQNGVKIRCHEIIALVTKPQLLESDESSKNTSHITVNDIFSKVAL